MLLDREIRFTIRSVLQWKFLPVVAASLAMLLMFALLYAKWDTSSVAAWIQALGSILALVVAIAIPYRFRVDDDRARDHAHAMRLNTVIWEAQRATLQLLNKEKNFQLKRPGMVDLELTLSKSRHFGGGQKVPRSIGVRRRDVDFFNRIMHRASANLDDDLCPKRQVIAAKFRFNLSVLISSLEVRVDAEPDSGLLAVLESGYTEFTNDLVKLFEVCSFLSSIEE